MAARTPTNYVQWHDLEAIAGDKPIRAALIDNLLDDMEFYLNSPLLLYGQTFRPMTHTGAAKLFREFYLSHKDHCDSASDSDQDVEATVYAWASNATTSGTVKLIFETTGGTQTLTYTLTADASAKTWFSFQTSSFVSKPTAETGANRPGLVQVQLERTGGAGSIILAGIMIVAT